MTAPDARALAHEIMNKGYVRCRADTGLPVAEEVKHSALCDAIQSALAAVRNDALEEVAKYTFDQLCDAQRPDRTAVAERMSNAIRALMDHT